MIALARNLLLAAAALFLNLSLGAQSGAIFTTNKFGDTVNGNKYSKPGDVYVRTSGVLPDGTYYFQVTNTSGTVLLSQDGTAARTVTIAGGIIVDAGQHPLGSEVNGKPGSANVVQLAPILESPDGNYKVWLTSTLVSGGYHGFVPSKSKTDNFKVEKGKPTITATITGTTFYDDDELGTQDPGERGLTGWRVELRRKGVTTLHAVTFTNENGDYFFPGLPLDGTEYVVTELAPIFGPIVNGVQTVTSNKGFLDEGEGGRWLSTTPRSGTTAPVLTAAVTGPDFGNIYFVLADTGTGGTTPFHDKGWWHSVHGKAELANCPGWQTLLNTMTNPFTSNPGFTSVTPSDQARVTACLSASSSPVSLYRSSPVLTNWIYRATTFSLFADWVLSDALGHSAFKLSREIAAAILNVKCGSLTGTTVFINTDTSGGLNLVSFDEMAYKAVCVLLNHPLAFDTAATPSTTDAAAVKAAIDACLNEFGGINTGSTVVWKPGEGGSVPDPQVGY